MMVFKTGARPGMTRLGVRLGVRPSNVSVADDIALDDRPLNDIGPRTKRRRRRKRIGYENRAVGLPRRHI